MKFQVNIFAIAINHLSDFYISRSANVEDFLNINVFFNGKYKCNYKRSFISNLFI